VEPLRLLRMPGTVELVFAHWYDGTVPSSGWNMLVQQRTLRCAPRPPQTLGQILAKGGNSADAKQWLHLHEHDNQH